MLLSLWRKFRQINHYSMVLTILEKTITMLIILAFERITASLEGASPTARNKKNNWNKRRWVEDSCARTVFRFLVAVIRIGSLSNHDGDGSENVTWKCNFAFLQSFFNYSKSLCLKKCVVTILELDWNQRLGHKRTKLNNSHHTVTCPHTCKTGHFTP